MIHISDSKQLKKKFIYIDIISFKKPLCSLISKLHYFFVALFVANPITTFKTESNLFHSKNTQFIQLCQIQNQNFK